DDSAVSVEPSQPAGSPEARVDPFGAGASPDPSENQLSPASGSTAVAKIALKRVTASELKGGLDSPPPKPARKPRGTGGLVWKVISTVVFIALFGLIGTVVLNEGKVDASLSWTRLKEMVSKPQALVAFDISNGLYDTRAGRPVFYVRGEVRNRGGSAS